RVERFDGNGGFLGEFRVPNLAFPESGEQRGLHLAVDGSSGDVYVYNSATRHDIGGVQVIERIERYAADGTELGAFGAFGTGPGQFTGDVLGLALDSGGNVYAADSGASRVVVFSRTGSPLGQWGVGADVTQIGGLAVDPSDRVHVVVAHSGVVGVRRF